MTTTSDPAALLAHLKASQITTPLSILHLAEPILEASTNSTHSEASPTRQPSNLSTSTASAPDQEHKTQLTPSSLSADLQHYRDLFSKLRFSYLEQVTKEKYLRSIVGDPPLLVTPADNAALEEKLTGMKAELKTKKRETDNLVAEMESFARELAGKYETVQAGRTQLETLPKEVEELQREVEGLREEVARKQAELGREGEEVEPRYVMGLEATGQAVEEQKRRSEAIDREIAELEGRLPGKVSECERVERELEELERRREEVTRQAREVKRIREEGGRDLVGERGRWYTAQESVLKGLLQT